MKQKFTLLFAFFYLTMGALWAQQTSSKSTIKDAATGLPIKEAKITVVGKKKHLTLVPNTDGSFYLDPQVLPGGRYTVSISAPGYTMWQSELVVSKKSTVSQEIKLQKEPALWDRNLNDEVVVSDLYSEEGEPIDYTPMLTASPDPYSSAAAYTFSPARFRIRGYDAQYTPMYLNGVEMNDMNTGYGVWSLWGGLNDVVRNQELSTGIQPLFSAFGNVGPASNIDTRASLQRAQTRFTYSNSNRTYSNRLMATYSTGKMNNGWSVTAGLSARWGNGEYSYVKGQFYKAFGYFLGIERELNKEHALALNIIGAPTQRGVASASTQEAYDLMGSNFYNPNIGYQNGKIRNARVRDNHEPIIQLSHFWTKGRNFKLNTTVGVRFGYNGYSALTWFQAPDPRPDYYRRLPSYYTRMASQESAIDYEATDYLTNLWRTNPNTGYINWDKLYEVNRNNHVDTYDSNGVLLASGLRSEYSIEDRRTDQLQWNYATTMNAQIKDWFKLDAGINYRWNKTHYYSLLKDMLGGEYWYDIDKFAERDFGSDPAKVQLNLLNPDHIARKGDKFGYDYEAYIQKGNSWFMTRYDLGRVNAYAGMMFGLTSMYRHGNQQLGLFPYNSFCNSEWLHFIDFGAKAGAIYQINGHHFIEANGAIMQQAPYFRNVFVSPRTRHTFVNNPKEENIYSADLSYQLRLPWLRGRITGFYTRIDNQTRNMSFYDDLQRAFSNYTLSGVSSTYSGVEVGLEAKLSPTLTANGAFTWGSYIYSSDPAFIQTVDNSAKTIDEGTVYWRGLNMSGTPQTAATIGITYRAPWYGMFGINVNYFDRNFISMNPVLRTEKARVDMNNQYTIPEKLKGGVTVDAFIGYSYMVSWGKYLRFNLSVSNLLNNRNIHSGGFEQLRVRSFDGKYQRPFDSKYYYMYGMNFFFNTSFQF